jgi:hypothetical protein
MINYYAALIILKKCTSEQQSMIIIIKKQNQIPGYVPQISNKYCSNMAFTEFNLK